jgi:hypothetical protein
MSSKEWRMQKIAEGLCWTCGCRPHIQDRRECEICRDKRRTRQKEEYHSSSHSKSKQAIKKRREKLKRSGLCTRCGKEKPKENSYTCERCLNKQSERVQELKNQVFEHYGGYKCVCCGETTKEFLMLDHINNDGADHRRKVFGENRGNGSSRTLYLWIIRNEFPELFQVLCANCNWGKRDTGICPHQQT